MTSCRTYSPYGAWELKRTYQRNLLLANASVILLVSLAIVLPSVFGGEERVVPKPPDDPVSDGGGIFDWHQDEIQIIRSRGGGPRTQDLAVGIPEPIADSLLFDDDDVQIYSRDELRQGFGPSDGTDAEIDYDGSGGYGLGGSDDLIPEPDQFVIVDQQPEMIHEVKPAYPRLAKRAGVEGTVWIQALVDIDGSVRDARVKKSSKNDSLDEAALAAAWQNRFTPAIRGNQPVLMWVTYKVSFTLK